MLVLLPLPLALLLLLPCRRRRRGPDVPAPRRPRPAAAPDADRGGASPRATKRRRARSNVTLLPSALPTVPVCKKQKASTEDSAAGLKPTTSAHSNLPA